MPYVLLKTIFDLDPNDSDPTLRAIARIWKREAVVPAGSGGTAWTMDHIGIGPPPSAYDNGVARASGPAQLPFGFAYENPRSFEPLSTAQNAQANTTLVAKRVFTNTSLLLAKLKTVDHEDNWEKDRPTFGTPGTMDRVFFSCAACHVGRVMVSGKMKFLPGMPNTEIEAQYYSKLLMLTGAALVESGFDVSKTTPPDPALIKPRTDAVRALYTAMLDKALKQPETIYGSSPAEIARAKLQTIAAADEFPSVIKDLIAVAVKTHFIYYVVARNNAYKAALPDVLEDRPGQMDAFGIASGLVAIHTRRPDNSFLNFVQQDNPKSPIFTGFSKANGLPSDIPGMTDTLTDPKAASDRIFRNISAWAPPVPAPIDVKSVNWATSRFHANWDGNQGASSRTLASGASATGDPRMVNVRIHEPLNPFIDNLPAPPYPFASVDLTQAKEGKAIFKEKCAGCHKPKNAEIYPASMLGVDANRTKVNTSVSRYGLAALVTEACTIYGRNNEGKPGANWCVPTGDWQARLDEYFRDTPRRVVDGSNGYKADMLARHLGAGALPAQRVGTDDRPVGVPVDAPGEIPPRESPLRRGAGRLRVGGRSEGAIQPQRHHPGEGVRHLGDGQGQHRPSLRIGLVSGYDRSGSHPGSPGDSDPRARLARRRAARVSQNSIELFALRCSHLAPWHSWHLGHVWHLRSVPTSWRLCLAGGAQHRRSFRPRQT